MKSHSYISLINVTLKPVSLAYQKTGNRRKRLAWLCFLVFAGLTSHLPLSPKMSIALKF